MRPLPYGSGKGCAPAVQRTPRKCFNEAAPLRKRKGIGESRGGVPRPCFNEAAPLRKRKVLGTYDVITVGTEASMRPLPYGSGKRAALPRGCGMLAASMRPLPYGSGKESVTWKMSAVCEGFNEAAPLRKRKEFDVLPQC